ncbi:hypothetical protein BU17DRAFT_99508 [Hysterangium stoloniferum]|nr:hypothetical protein BU17DRAFT_99508 [Hysterangium stoloniferum]
MHQDRHVPLKEVSLYGTVVESAQIAQFLQIFGGIPLTTLYLECLRVIDGVVLKDIVNAFPKLQRLIIRSKRLNTQWEFDLEELVERFSNLQDLEYLGWDYTSVLTGLASVYETGNEEDDLRITNRAIVPLMALVCPRLQVVEYFHAEFSHAFSIQRDDLGDVDHVDWRRSGGLFYGHTLQQFPSSKFAFRVAVLRVVRTHHDPTYFAILLVAPSPMWLLLLLACLMPPGSSDYFLWQNT